MSQDDRIDDTLRALGTPRLPPPPLAPALEAELSRLTPAAPRKPRRQFLLVAALSLIYGGLLLLFLHLRPDLMGLPRLWLIVYCTAWLASFLVITWLVLVPGPGRVMPNWRHAGMGAALALVCFVAGGLLFDRHVPGVSVMLEPSLGNVLRGARCLFLGTVTAVVPVILGALLLRGALPVGSRWAGAAMGAAGGSLGGLMLHLHCPVADAVHLGVVHGGVVLVSAVVGALVIPRATRT